MRASLVKKWLVAATLAATLGLTSCGDEKGSKKVTNDSPAITTIDSAEVDGSGTAMFRFSSKSGTEFTCRIIAGDKEGEWIPCPQGSLSYPLQPGETIKLQVRLGEDGMIAERSITRIPESNTAQKQTQNKEQAQVQPNEVISFEQLGLGGSRFFRIPQGKRLVRFSTSNNLRRNTKLIYALSNDTAIQELAGGRRNCDDFGFQNGPVFDRIPATTVLAKSTPQGPADPYCYVQTQTEQAFNAITNNTMSPDMIEVASLPGQPFEYISAAVYRRRIDVLRTKTLFETQCGVPGNTYNTGAVAVPGFSRVSYRLYGQQGNRPGGFINGSGITFFNVPVSAPYWPGQLPNIANVHVCLVDGLQLGVPNAQNGGRFYIGAYEFKTVGRSTSDKLVFHFIKQPFGGEQNFEFVLRLAQESLSSVLRTLPASN